MLTRPLAAVLAAGLAAVLLLAAGEQDALAGGSGSGSGYGSVTCGQSYAAQCTVAAGAGPSAGAKPGVGAQGAGQEAGTAAPVACPVAVQPVVCPDGPAGGVGAAAPAVQGDVAAAAGADPLALAVTARETLVLPVPVVETSPAEASLQLVNLPTWLWVSPAEWAAVSKTAAVPGEAVTATATPVLVTWRPGDGSTVTCHGPGTPYTSADNPGSPSPDCGHTYARSSAGQPGGAFTATVTITWDVAWSGTGGAGGVLAPLETTATARFEVAESQALNTGGS
jgi:hypothetical protein